MNGFIRLVTIMQTKLEVSGLANQLFFFIRLEVPPLNYSLEVDSWVWSLLVDPPFWFLWQGARGVWGGVADTNQTIHKPKVQLGRIYPAWRGPGDWRSRGLVWRARCGEWRGESARGAKITPEGFSFLRHSMILWKWKWVVFSLIVSSFRFVIIVISWLAYVIRATCRNMLSAKFQ